MERSVIFPSPSYVQTYATVTEILRFVSQDSASLIVPEKKVSIVRWVMLPSMPDPEDIFHAQLIAVVYV